MEIKVTFYDNNHYYEVFVNKGVLTNRACISKSKKLFENPAQTLKVLEVQTLRWQDAVDTWLIKLRIKLKSFFSKRCYKKRKQFSSFHTLKNFNNPRFQHMQFQKK